VGVIFVEKLGFKTPNFSTIGARRHQRGFGARFDF
jgi:hypothetical protein